MSYSSGCSLKGAKKMSDFNNAKDRPEDFDDFDASQQAEDVYNEEDEYQDGYDLSTLTPPMTQTLR